MTIDYYKAAWATADAVDAFVDGQDKNQLLMVIKAGASSLRDYVETGGKLSDEVLELVNWDIAYLVVCDSTPLGLYTSITIAHVCNYWGIDQTMDDELWKPSPSRKAKYFGVKDLTMVSEMTGLGLSTLNKWAFNKPIVLHSLIEYTANVIATNEED